MLSRNRSIKTMLVATLVAPILWGCAGHMTREEYDRNIQGLEAANKSLTRRNAELEALGAECEDLRARVGRLGNIDAELRAILEKIQGDGITLGGDGQLTLTADAFDPGKNTIKAGTRKKIQELADALKSRDVTIRIVGHTDDTEIRDSAAQNPTKMNLELGARRAIAAADVFKDSGIPETRMYVESAGQTRPIASNSTKEGKRQNRRVDVYLINGGGSGGGNRDRKIK